MLFFGNKKKKQKADEEAAKIDKQFVEEYYKLCQKYERELVYTPSHNVKRLKK